MGQRKMTLLCNKIPNNIVTIIILRMSQEMK